VSKLTFVQWVGGPLAKTFKKDGTKETPRASKLTSHEREYKDIAGLYEAVKEAAGYGWSLFTGEFKTPLVKESRASKAKPDIKREWVCLDLDDLDMPSVEDFIAEVPELQGVSYVVQYSNSHGLEGKGLNAHVWFLLDKPITTKEYAAWLHSINFLDTFLDGLELSTTTTSLSYKIDVSSSHSSRLIYIAPPIFEDGCGVKNPFDNNEDRIKLVEKDKPAIEVASIPPARTDENVIRSMKLSFVNRKRQELGLPGLTQDKVGSSFNPETVSDLSIIPRETVNNGDETIVKCDIKKILPNGDEYEGTRVSWWFVHGYLDETSVLYNFKDEPPIKIKNSAPEFVKQWNADLSEEDLPDLGAMPDFLGSAFDATDEDKIKVEGDYWDRKAFFVHDSQRNEYCGVTRNQDGTGFTFQPRTKGTAPNFAHNFGAEYNKDTFNTCPSVRRVRDVYPPYYLYRDENDMIHMNEAYIPEVCSRKVPDGKKVDAKDSAALLQEQAPLSYRYLVHTFGDADTLSRFLNWVACHLRGVNVQTAWLLRGMPGSGKSSIVDYFLHYILTDGRDLPVPPTTSVDQGALLDSHNGFLRDVFFVEGAEFNDRALPAQKRQELAEIMKNMISSGHLSIREMRMDRYPIRNHVGWIFTSNEPTPFVIALNDRRYEIPAYQKTSVADAFPEFAVVAGGKKALPNAFFSKHLAKELPVFSQVISAIRLDPSMVSRAMETEAKTTMAGASETSEKALARWIQTGDLDSLAETIRSSIESEGLQDNLPLVQVSKEYILSVAKHPTRIGFIPDNYLKAIYSLVFPHYRKNQSLVEIKRSLDRFYEGDGWPRRELRAKTAERYGLELEGVRVRGMFKAAFDSTTQWTSDDFGEWVEFASVDTTETNDVLPFTKVN